MKPGIKIALGLLLSLSSIAFIFFYDFYLKDKIDSVEVVVVKAGSEIDKSESITANKLQIERRSKESLIDGVILAKDLESIIGYDAKQKIVGNSMISNSMIDFEQIVPDESKGEAIRPIKDDWIYAKPGSLRRKDSVDIYLVYPDGKTSLQQNGPSSVSSEDTKENESIESKNLNQSMNINPFLKDVRVVYVKDSGNNEVVSTTENQSEDSRLNASSTISELEVILNEEDFAKLINEVIGNGAQLYISYQ